MCSGRFICSYLPDSLSLYTIPSWATIKVHVTANAKKADKTYIYDVSDSMTMVQWLPMIFAFPFANPFSVGKEVDSNTYNALVLKMKADGIL